MEQTLRILSCWFLLAGLVPLGGCASDAEDDEEDVMETENNLYASGDSIWPTRNIPVCWLNPSPQYKTQMEATRSALAESWEKVSRVQFVGWKRCAAGASGIRILIEDSTPRSEVGTQANSVTGPTMYLNFTFEMFSPSCQSKKGFCVRAIAVHEFGHALGFKHEQGRPDTPSWCNGEPPTPNGVMVGAWDRHSIMNYCNPKWLGNGELSPTDIKGVRQFYGKRPG